MKSSALAARCRLPPLIVVAAGIPAGQLQKKMAKNFFFFKIDTGQEIACLWASASSLTARLHLAGINPAAAARS